MDFISLSIGALIGISLWYAVFYFRYVDKEKVDNLRYTLKSAHTDLHIKWAENDELSSQNIILKDKVSELLIKNEDLSKIVSELNRYYFHIKDAHAKALELIAILKVYDKEFEEKITTDTKNSPFQSITKTT